MENQSPAKSALLFALKMVLLSILLAAAAAALNLIYQSCFARSDSVTAGQSADGSSTDNNAAAATVVVVDAGHGGMDSGAVSITGTPEKELNLAISSEFAALLRVIGINAVETRTEDIMLCGDAPKGSRKMTDLKSRLDIAELYPGALFLSIHMNKFSDPKYGGLQVWYSKNDPGSAILAGLIQDMNASLLQPDNTRKTKAAGSNIYLLDRIKAPAVTIECGFLSNPADAAALETKEYRDGIAAMLTGAVCEFLNAKNSAY